MNNLFYKRMLLITSVFGLSGVVIGAFGAHYLKTKLIADDLETLRTGVLYLFIHVVALLAVNAIALHDPNSRMLKAASISFIVGVILFSGSLFMISTNNLTGLEGLPIGILTPLGGLCFIAGWLLLIIYSVRRVY